MQLVDLLATARKEARRRLPLLSIKLATPCDAKWEEMTGDEKNRLCLACDKSVHDLTAMSADEIATFLGENAEACVRIYERRDQKVMRDDCPVGLRRSRHRAIAFSGLSLAAAALGCFTALATMGGTAEAAEPGRMAPPTVATEIAQTMQSDPGILNVIGPSSMIISIDGAPMGSGIVGIALTSYVSHVVTAVDPKTGDQHTECVYVPPGKTKTLTIQQVKNIPRPGGMRRTPNAPHI